MVGKVLAEKVVNAEGLVQALGKIWCPIKGVSCRDLGENHFLITFHQASGKRRALEEGPWMFGKDFVVLVDFDETKGLEDLVFAFIPIWIRASKMPFGMMNKVTGKAITNEVGEFIQMEAEEDGTAVGQFLHIKIRLDIRKPLMRGVTLCVGEGKKEIWCPLVYEFLPDFCYTCGIIGHTDKVCGVKLKEGEEQQFSKKLRFIPEKKKWEDGHNVGSRGSKGFYQCKVEDGSSMGSDGPSWRKEKSVSKDGGDAKRVDEEEVTSPVKKQSGSCNPCRSKKCLVLSKKEKDRGSVEGLGDRGQLVTNHWQMRRRQTR